ncbi:hypothetical protein OBBRIDRAFT_790067 [Obba rivulosa]|uniref:Uncharacterized protein n=1 Tax=Obba rivulosa TaxID=1052685 RepID=A0A8E2DPV4_9APHY|nr:hypothetical protein OBBRIDRAFT_790067 [Obba rivulosa]
MTVVPNGLPRTICSVAACSCGSGHPAVDVALLEGYSSTGAIRRLSLRWRHTGSIALGHTSQIRRVILLSREASQDRPDSLRGLIYPQPWLQLLTSGPHACEALIVCPVGSQ